MRFFSFALARGMFHLSCWTLLAGAVLLLSGGCSNIRPPKGVQPFEREMTVTAYCPCGKCCGWERTWYGRPVYSYGPNKGKPKQIGMTASGRRARHGTIAADTAYYPFGTVMYIDGYGYGRVEDRGGAIKGNKIDVYFRSHDKALEWGKRSIRVKVWLPSEEER